MTQPSRRPVPGPMAGLRGLCSLTAWAAAAALACLPCAPVAAQGPATAGRATAPAAAPATPTATEIVVATVNNGHMIEMQKLSPHFERAHPGVKVKWVTLEEGVLRQRVTADIATRGGQYDVITIGMLEAPLWGRKGWLRPLQFDATYDVDDLLPAMRRGLSVEGTLYAAPFYGESSMLMYRKDLTDAAGIRFPERPTWEMVRSAAQKLHNPSAGVHGICLRGRPGWGENMTLLTPLVNSFGGQWFDMAWRPQLDSKPWRDGVAFYVDLLKKHGPPGSAANGFNELLALFQAGHCALWVDATIAGSFVADPERSTVARHVAFAQSPYAVTPKGANWLWAWALAVPASTRQADAAQRFVAWATSREYIQLVASTQGWARVPTGTRKSTYAQPAFMQVARHATAEKQAIDSANPNDSTLPKSPYVGVQFAVIPEFQAIGTAVGAQISQALAGRSSVDQALKTAQAAAEREMRRGGYLP